MPSSTEGTHRLRSAMTKTPEFRGYQGKAWALLSTPERRAAQTDMKLSEEAHRNNSLAHMGVRPNLQTRREMSETHKRRGTWPAAAGRPWSEDELALLRNLPPKEVVERTDRTYSAVSAMRFSLGLTLRVNWKRRNRGSA